MSGKLVPHNGGSSEGRTSVGVKRPKSPSPRASPPRSSEFFDSANRRALNDESSLHYRFIASLIFVRPTICRERPLPPFPIWGVTTELTDSAPNPSTLHSSLPSL